MAAARIGLHKQVVVDLKKLTDKGHQFDLQKWLRETLRDWGVVALDPCCPNFVGAAANAEGFLAPVIPSGASQDIAAGTGGAINVTSYHTTINTDAGGDAFTLADGTQVGQLKKITLVVDGGGDGVVTPANFGASATATFNDANDYVVLQWNGTDWIVIENVGVTIA